MSTYAQFDENGSQHQIGTGSGYDAFCDWVDGLDADTYPALKQLRQDGESAGFEQLIEEIDEAVAEVPPPAGVADVARSLRDAIAQNKDAEILLITDGTRTDDGSPEENFTTAGPTGADE